MPAHSYHYHHRGFPRFGRAGWNPRWCKCQNYPNTLSLILWNLSNCIPHLCHTCIRCLNTLNSCGWAYGSTLTPLPPQRFPQIWESSLKSYMMSMWKWSHYAIVEGVKPFKLHPTSISYIYKVFEHFKQLWMGIWQHIHHHRRIPRFGRAGWNPRWCKC